MPAVTRNELNEAFIQCMREIDGSPAHEVTSNAGQLTLHGDRVADVTVTVTVRNAVAPAVTEAKASPIAPAEPAAAPKPEAATAKPKSKKKK